MAGPGKAVFEPPGLQKNGHIHKKSHPNGDIGGNTEEEESSRSPSTEADTLSLSHRGCCCWLLRPKIHEYTGYKRTGFVKPDSVKLAMGHLLHDEAAP